MEFLRPKDVMQKMKVKKTYLYSMVKKGLFPRPRKLGPMSIWTVEEVERVMALMYSGLTEEKLREAVREIEEARKKIPL